MFEEAFESRVEFLFSVAQQVRASKRKIAGATYISREWHAHGDAEDSCRHARDGEVQKTLGTGLRLVCVDASNLVALYMIVESEIFYDC